MSEALKGNIRERAYIMIVCSIVWVNNPLCLVVVSKRERKREKREYELMFQWHFTTPCSLCYSTVQ